MRPARAAFVVVAALAAAIQAPAGAVDRSLGAGIARPSPGGAPWTSAETLRLRVDIDALLAAARTLRGAHAGLLAVDARTGGVLYARNADDAFVPASTMKLLTGSVALGRLGPAYRLRTAAYTAPLPGAAAATVEDGTLHGTLVVRGGGDAQLADADLAALAAALRERGIARIDGGIAVDDGRYAPEPYLPGWTWDDFAYGYAAPVSAASFAGNTIRLHVEPAAPGLPARVAAAPLPGIVGPCDAACAASGEPHVVADVTTGAAGSADTVDLTRDSAGVIHVIGSIPAAAPPDDIDAAVPYPPRFLRAALAAQLGAAGITVALGIPPGAAAAAAGDVVWTHDGAPLRDVLADMWWPSDNLIAELLLREVAVGARGIPGTTEAGIAAASTWLRAAGVDPAGVTLADGSGLSSYDRLTPRALAAILEADWRGPNRDLVIDDLPLAGVRGTLAGALRGSRAERRAFLKTGSMNHTRAIAGYLATERHGAVTLAWCVDDWLGRDADLNALRAAVLSRIVAAP